MNRRDALKLIPAAGLFMWAGHRLVRPSGELACYAVSAAPEADIERLLRLPELAGAPDLEIAVYPVAPSPQDLTLIIGGRPVDPLAGGSVAPRTATLAETMRSRREPGHRLIAIERRNAPQPDVVRFEVDGAVREEIALGRDYARIVVAGPAGDTVFRLQDGRLSVVKASCRHGLCRRMQAQAGGRIICAPNRLVATVPRNGTVIDAFTG